VVMVSQAGLMRRTRMRPATGMITSPILDQVEQLMLQHARSTIMHAQADAPAAETEF
jgi:hypothetical protein